MRHWLLYLWFALIVHPIARLLLGVSVHGLCDEAGNAPILDLDARLPFEE